MTELKPVLWQVTDPEPRRQLLWFCSDPTKEIWVEPFRVERTENADEIMAKVRLAINEHCDVDGGVLFAGDPTRYILRRVELRTNRELEKVLSFDRTLVQLNPHILIKIITRPARPNSGSHDVPEHTIEHRVLRAMNLAQATRWAKGLAEEAAANSGIVVVDDDLIHLLDRIEIYYDGQFQRVFPLDYGHLSLDGE